MDKICYICKRSKNLSEFNKNISKKDGLKDECRSCQSYSRRLSYRKLINKNPRNYIYGRPRKDKLAASKGARDALKYEVFSHYASGKPKCAICLYEDIRALCIDHIHNNGAIERKPLGGSGGTGFYRILKKNRFPPGYQVLCSNCNTIKEFRRRMGN